jgi:hypothetical protein
MAQNDQKVIELYQNDLDYITSLFNNKTINKKTFSYYVYYYLRIVRTNKHKSLIPKVIEVCEKLNTYNAINRIEPYDVMVFSSGGFAFFSNRGNDLNLSVDHLIELLKEEQ